jgi:hypothetical protein
MPHSSNLAFKNFLTWFVTDAERALSLKGMLISAASYFVKIEVHDRTKDKGVKAHVKQLETNHGLESAPSTTATPMMLGAMVVGENSIIQRRFEKTVSHRELLIWRWVMQVLLEGVGGCRVGEATSGGDFHGLLANNSSIILSPEAIGQWAKETVEVRLEHSKTGHARYINMAGTTVETKLPIAASMRKYWYAAGIETSIVEEGGLMIERPDFWVVKVTLLGMDQTELETFTTWLMDPNRSSGIQAYAKNSVSYARTRHGATSAGSQAKKHVNIAGGRAGSREVLKALAEVKTFLIRLKLEKLPAEQAADMAAVVPGPLLISTQHALMGLQPSSTYATMKQLLTSACDEVGANDPHMSAQQRAVAKWTNHSMRRTADTTARRTKLVTEHGREIVTTQEIDLYFGWHEEELTKDMQIHYSTFSLQERIRQARLTCMT